MAERAEVWRARGLDTEKCILTAASYVDNIYAVGSDATDATYIPEDFEIQPGNKWGLRFKPSSKEYLVPKGADHRPVSEQWTKVAVMEVLGHSIQDSSEVRVCVNTTRTKMWAAYFCNVGKCRDDVDFERKARLIERAVWPIIGYPGGPTVGLSRKR